MTRVEPATREDIARYFPGVRIPVNWIGFAAKDGRLVRAVGGVLEYEPGQWIMFLDGQRSSKRPIFLRYAVKALEYARENGAQSIIALCDEDIPRAVPFLEHLGFARTNEVENKMVVWKWQG